MTATALKSDGYTLVAPSAEQRAAFAELQAEMRKMASTFAGPATTPAKLDGLIADCERIDGMVRRLKIASMRAYSKRRAGR